MSVAPHSGIIDFGTFTPPATPLDGIQGEVPAPLVGQEGYVLSASGWVPGGSISGLGTMSTQNADNVAITGGSINGTTIGASTASSGAFTTLIGGGGSANYAQITGGATTKAVQFQTLGTDTNISQVFQSKGTGAIDLAAGSSGVNISNGGTVTALTITSLGTTTYTSIPVATISAPTTSGGVQATANVFMGTATGGATVSSGGTGYSVNDVLTLVGGTSTIAAQLTVSTVSSGVITGVTVSVAGNYSALPANPVSVTGGTGAGATFTVLWRLNSFTITNAGSGYVEQPTVTFSGGGGSGAAAYATVGSIPTIKSVGSALSFVTPAGEQFRVQDSGGTATDRWIQVNGAGSGASPILQAWSTGAATGLTFSTRGASDFSFSTAASSFQQFRVAHTASAVNYVQVTGAATTARPAITAQGSDTNIGVNYQTKGTGQHIFYTDAGGAVAFVCSGTGNASYIRVDNAATGAAPAFSSQGVDTNIDLSLTPKGTGLVRFGTYTAGAPTATGYINIKAADGTTYKLLVST